jgi:hypothetical protein
MKSWLIIALIVAFGFSLRAHADGVDVYKWLTLEETTQKAKLVLLVTVKEVAHLKKTKKAYGEYRTYVDEYRLKVTVDEVLEGDASLKGQTIWMQQSGTAIPGKQAIVDEEYQSKYSLNKAKKKDTFIRILSRGDLVL